MDGYQYCTELCRWQTSESPRRGLSLLPVCGLVRKKLGGVPVLSISVMEAWDSVAEKTMWRCMPVFGGSNV